MRRIHPYSCRGPALSKSKLPSASFLLFLSTGLLALAADGFPSRTAGADQAERRKFFALRAVSEDNVLKAGDSLGEPDGRSAEILPGGQLVLLMEDRLYPFPTIGPPEGGGGLGDSGSVVGQGEKDFVIEGWLPTRDAQGRFHYAWTPLGLSASGFMLGLEGSVGADKIRITNPGAASLFVDAVVGFGREAARRPEGACPP